MALSCSDVCTSDLNRKVYIEEPQRLSNGRGGQDIEWTELKSAWASIKPISGNEALRHQQVSSSVTHKLVLRWTAGIRPQMRIRYTDNDRGVRYFNIRRVTNREEANRFLDIDAEEGRGDEEQQGWPSP